MDLCMFEVERRVLIILLETEGFKGIGNIMFLKLVMGILILIL